MHPRTLSESVDESEKRVFTSLTKLNDDWIVIHDLRFVVPAIGTKPARNGQADFVLLHPERGMLVLEAKGGGYEVEDGEWYTFPGGKRTKMGRSPFSQAQGNRYDITNFLTYTHGIRVIPAGHAVAFTDGAPRGNLGPEAPSSIIVHGEDLNAIGKTVSRLSEHWFGPAPQPIPKDTFASILKALLPTGTVTADRKYTLDVALVDIRDRTTRQIELTGEQLAVLEATSSHTYLAVLGAAGTGKTLIAVKQANIRAGRGERVVFVADQRYLHSTLRQEPLLKHGNIVLGTVEEMAAQLNPDHRDGDDICDSIMRSVDAGQVFDCVIVDEAQSYEDEVLNCLRLLSDDHAYLFADPYQKDSQGMWRPPDSPKDFWLTQNCRNSLAIAKLVARISGALAPSNGPAGPTPRFIEMVADPSNYRDQVADLVNNLLESLPANDLAVLSCSQDVTAVSHRLRQDGHPIARKPTDDGVRVLAASQYRGCESPAVLFLAGPSQACESEDIRAAHYVATSRAIADLTIVGNPADWNQFSYLLEQE